MTTWSTWQAVAEEGGLVLGLCILAPMSHHEVTFQGESEAVYVYMSSYGDQDLLSCTCKYFNTVSRQASKVPNYFC